MTRRSTLFAILLATVVALAAPRAYARGDEDGRGFGVFAGFGFSRIAAHVVQPGVDASLAGWGNGFEAGLDVPFSRTFGMTLSAGIDESDLRNTYKADNYLDQTTFKSKGARAGFFFKNVSLGYGMKNLSVDLKSISTTTGASTAHLEGQGSFTYAAFSIDHRGMMRGSLEIQANTTELNNFSYTDYTVGLKAYILLGGLLD